MPPSPPEKVSPGVGGAPKPRGLEVELDISTKCYFTITIH